MPDPFPSSPLERLSQNQSEQLAIKFELAKAENWQELAKIRLEALEKDPASFLDTDTNPKDIPSLDDETYWKSLLEDPATFFMLAKNDSEIVGLVGAIKRDGENGSYYIRWTYVTKELRGKQIGEKMERELLQEIRKRGGSKVDAWILKSNENYSKIIAHFERLGFHVVDSQSSEKGTSIECDL